MVYTDPREGALYSLMYLSIPSLTTLPGQTPGEFLERANSPPPRHKESTNPDPWGRKIVLKPHSRGNYFQKFSKKTQKL